jgi:hypothetical protein
MAWSLIPLLIRMAFIHPVLLWGTNNAADTELMSDEDVRHRALASKLLLGARIFYAILYDRTVSFTSCEYANRTTASGLPSLPYPSSSSV